MRIAFISHEFPPDTGKGGIGTYTSQVAKAMVGAGNEVHVFAGSAYRAGVENIDGYRVHRIKCTDGNDFRHRVLAVFTAQNSVAIFDIIESPEINGNAWEIKKAFPAIPLVVRLHAPNHLVESLKKTYLPFTAKLRYVLGGLRRFKIDLGYWQPYNKNDDADYRFIQCANVITAPSEAMKDWVVKNWQIEAGKIAVIPNIFSASPAFLQIPIVEENKYNRIVFFGRLNVLKGLVNATKAMKKILVQNPDWQFRVIGDDGPGPQNTLSMKEWMQLELKGVLSRVEFLDGMAYEDLPAAISDCEIVLMPSLFESFSYACAEAMAAGKAVIGSDNAGMADLVENNSTGILINPYNYTSIIDSLQKLIVDNKLRYRLGVNARKSILEKQHSPHTVNLFREYYSNLIKGKFVSN